MKKAFILLFLALLCLNVFAQTFEDWRTGVVVLGTNEVVTGSIYLPGYETVFLSIDSVVKVFPAYRVKQVRFYDPEINVNRRFIVIQERNSYTRLCKLYEVVLVGTIDVLRRAVETVPISSLKDQTAYEYFIRSEDILIPLSKFRHTLYDELVKNTIGLRIFVKANKLNPTTAADAIRIIQFSNKQEMTFSVSTIK